MVDFSLWDILRNLLLAARWTVLLSLIVTVFPRWTVRGVTLRIGGPAAGAVTANPRTKHEARADMTASLRMGRP